MIGISQHFKVISPIEKIQKTALIRRISTKMQCNVIVIKDSGKLSITYRNNLKNTIHKTHKNGVVFSAEKMKRQTNEWKKAIFYWTHFLKIGIKRFSTFLHESECYFNSRTFLQEESIHDNFYWSSQKHFFHFAKHVHQKMPSCIPSLHFL